MRRSLYLSKKKKKLYIYSCACEVWAIVSVNVIVFGVLNCNFTSLIGLFQNFLDLSFHVDLLLYEILVAGLTISSLCMLNFTCV